MVIVSNVRLLVFHLVTSISGQQQIISDTSQQIYSTIQLCCPVGQVEEKYCHTSVSLCLQCIIFQYLSFVSYFVSYVTTDHNDVGRFGQQTQSGNLLVAQTSFTRSLYAQMTRKNNDKMHKE